MELVNRVNNIKLHFSGSPGGTFYINEYKQVLVPVNEETNYYYAGEYSKPLTFEFEGKIISGRANNEEGELINPGDQWIGPHPGIPYVLKSGGTDIYYRYQIRQGVEKEVRLSKCIGIDLAKKVAAGLSKHKGYSGGRFYVNEFANAFTPINTPYGIDYTFLGEIDLNEWFPKPVIKED
ncbi:MAG TPA: hypothetical protein VFC96_02425 [Anaerovoracaceae bacterium]|nr:hypothetical protein [Anaerovoracaceae bacterium]